MTSRAKGVRRYDARELLRCNRCGEWMCVTGKNVFGGSVVCCSGLRCDSGTLSAADPITALLAWKEG
jgi:hypothetical protein